MERDLKIQCFHERFSLAQVFSISRGSKTHADVVRVEVSGGGFKGQGECVPYARYGESVDTVSAQIKALPHDITRETLQHIMPAGAARNAVDCALWDLEAKQTGIRVWQLAGLREPEPVTTAFTLSLEEPEKMLLQAKNNAHRPLLKIKLGTPDDLPRLEAVRDGAPTSTIIVDANEGWDAGTFHKIERDLQRLNVAMVEQPLREGKDEVLDQNKFALPLCADESSHTSETLEQFVGKYSLINIKLDKTGGLTQAIKMKAKAEALGLEIFVGCMVATSLAMAPAMLLTHGATYVDLDGPLLLAQDRENAMRFEGSTIYPPSPKLWG